MGHDAFVVQFAGEVIEDLRKNDVIFDHQHQAPARRHMPVVDKGGSRNRHSKRCAGLGGLIAKQVGGPAGGLGFSLRSGRRIPFARQHEGKGTAAPFAALQRQGTT